MKFLVTGAAGFIGSNLCYLLLKKGGEVVGVDSLTDYYDLSLKRRNLESLEGEGRFTFIQGDLKNMDLGDLTARADAVFHLGAQPGVRASWGSGFWHYTDDNLLATQKLLEACKGKSIERFVFASTSSVYGDSETAPTPEDAPLLPISPYGVTKMACEHMCWLYLKQFGVPALALRYFTVYGPRQRPDMAFTKFLTAGMAGSPIEVYGDGEQTRDFTFVGDAVAATAAAAERGELGEAYNIGGGSRASVNQVIEIMNGILEKPLDVRYVDTQKGDVRHTWADTGKARNALGFSPEVDLERGLGKQLAWLKSLAG